MLIDNALRIIKPDPDSQYRLRSCQVCDGDDVAYVQYEDGGQEPWRVTCFDCGPHGIGERRRQSWSGMGWYRRRGIGGRE